MSRIDDLITKHCPNGVEYKELQEIFITRNGYTPSTTNKAFWTNGNIPWFRMEDIRANGNILSESIQLITKEAVKGGRLFPANSILVATSATIGEHALITVPHLSNQRFTSLSLKPDFEKKLDMRFIYYYCFVLDRWCLNNTTTSSFSSVNMAGFKSFKFPIPPLPVQQEIVDILDTFTKLEAELEAELEARQQQYTHYRDKLLNFDGKDVPLLDLGSVCVKTLNIKWKEHIGEEYEYIDLSSVDRENNQITETQKISDSNAPSRAQQIVQKDDIIFGTTRPTLKRFCVIPEDYDGQICSTGFCVLRADPKKILPKFLYFSITTSAYNDYVE